MMGAAAAASRLSELGSWGSKRRPFVCRVKDAIGLNLVGKSEMHDVAVCDGVVLALKPELAGVSSA